MPPSPRSLANLIPFQKGHTGNPGGTPAWRRELRDWTEFATGVPVDDKGDPVIHPDTGEPASRDDLVQQAVFKAACDLNRKDCTRAQQTWNAYVRGTPRQTVAVDVTTKGQALAPARVVLYAPDNGRGPKAEDVKAPSPDAPPVTVPESDGIPKGN